MSNGKKLPTFSTSYRDATNEMIFVIMLKSTFVFLCFNDADVTL